MQASQKVQTLASQVLSLSIMLSQNNFHIFLGLKIRLTITSKIAGLIATSSIKEECGSKRSAPLDANNIVVSNLPHASSV